MRYRTSRLNIERLQYFFQIHRLTFRTKDSILCHCFVEKYQEPNDHHNIALHAQFTLRAQALEKKVQNVLAFSGRDKRTRGTM